MRFSAIDEACGCLKITRPSALTLKLAQLSTARSLLWLIVSVSAVEVAVAEPDVTQVVGPPGPQLPATHTTGSSAPSATVLTATVLIASVRASGLRSAARTALLTFLFVF